MARPTLGYGGLLLASIPGFVVATLAHAQDAPAGDRAAVAEIIVTAQRREQKLQDVPISVASLSADALKQANVTTALDIGKLTSGVVFQQTTGTVTTFIRGLGNNQLAVGNEASVSLYIDGIYQARISPVLMRLNDVERVEVLKGPQGTLFGRNAMGGLVNIVTSDPKPGSGITARFMAGYGNYDTVEGSGYLAAGLGDKAAFSLGAVASNQGKGWGKNLLTGQDTDKQNDLAIRGKFVFEPAVGTKLTVSGNYTKSNSTIGLLGPYSGSTNPAPAGYGDGSGLLPILPSRYDKDSNLTDLGNTRGWGGYARLDQDLSFADLVITGALDDEQVSYWNDIDKSPQTYFHFIENGVRDNMRSAEIQLLSKRGSRIKWQGGFFYLHHQFYFPTPAQIFGESFGGATVLASDGGNNKSYAGYGQATLPLASKLNLTVGGRYNRDNVYGFGQTSIAVGSTIVADNPQTHASTHYDKFTWRAALDYKLADDVLAYASVSSGFKAGVYNIVTFSPVPIRPETLLAYEAGLKTELADHRVRLNLSAFYYDYKNPQVQTQQPDGATNLSNAGAARIYGIEGELQVAVTSQFALHASATALHSEYTDYADAPFYAPNPVAPYGLLAATTGNADGNKLSRAPEFTGNIGVSYWMPSAVGRITGRVNYAYTGAYFWTPDNLIRQNGYGLLDASLTLAVHDTGLSVEAWGSNLANGKYNLTANEFAGPVGVSSGPGGPRTYGIRVHYVY